MDGPWETANRDVDAFNTRDIEVRLSNFGPDAEFTAPGVSVCGRQEIAGVSHAWWAAFPDARITCERAIVSGSFVVTEGTFTGTHVAALRLPDVAFPATGDRIASHYAAVYEVRDGLIVAKHVYFDRLPLLGQPPRHWTDHTGGNTGPRRL